MPELPEVESILRGLCAGSPGIPSILNQEIIGSSLFWNKTLASPDPAFFHAFLRGRSITTLSRRGKFLLLHLDQDYLIIHLRMSGDLSMQQGLGLPGAIAPIAKHDRLYLHFASGWGLVFNDPRKFGRVWLTPTPNEVLGQLGPEPLDESLDAARFFKMLHARSRQLKPLLLDQSFIAGMGNIYTDEALFAAGLHPLRSSDSLSQADAGRLLTSLRQMLAEGIRQNGASIDWVYRGGDFQNHFQVYQQAGKPCPHCGRPIEKIWVGQRGTHFCPSCQPLN